MTVEAWKHRAEFNTPQSLASFSDEIEAAIGDQPEVVVLQEGQI